MKNDATKVTEGEDAGRLLRDPAFRRLFDSRKTEHLVRAMGLAADPSKIEDMRMALLQARCLQDLEQDLQSVVLTGKQALQRVASNG